MDSSPATTALRGAKHSPRDRWKRSLILSRVILVPGWACWSPALRQKDAAIAAVLPRNTGQCRGAAEP